MKVLVVLGNILKDDNGMSDALKSRLTLALSVWQEYDMLILTGGITNLNSTLPEAMVMKAWMVERGVPANRILVECASRTTEQNAKYCAPILREWGATEVTVLSSKSHIDRTFHIPHELFLTYTGYDVSLLRAEI